MVFSDLIPLNMAVLFFYASLIHSFFRTQLKSHFSSDINLSWAIMPFVQFYFSTYTILLKLFGVHCTSSLDSKLLEEVLLLQVWIHFMCSEKLVELITTLRNSNLGDLRGSGMIKIHKCWLLFTFDFFCSHVLWIFLNCLKGTFSVLKDG